jgi:phytoene synthase
MEALAAAYERCRQLHRRHGRTYYLATRLLPAWKRRHVHALYGFTRYTDEIVDRVGVLPAAQRARRLAEWSDQFAAGLAGRSSVEDPLLPAVLHTISVFDIDPTDFQRFLASMAMDLTVTGYGTYAELLEYMDGSAAAVGTMMLPILQAPDRAGGWVLASSRPASRAAAREPARQLGLAFQLTNFIRDVAEDLDRGRVYLPAEDLDRFAVSWADLQAVRAAGVASPAVKELIAYEVGRARGHYARAAPGIPMLQPRSQACVRAAYRLYGEILGEIERADFDVFRWRAVVPTRRRWMVALGSMVPTSSEGVVVEQKG